MQWSGLIHLLVLCVQVLYRPKCQVLAPVDTHSAWYFNDKNFPSLATCKMRSKKEAEKNTPLATWRCLELSQPVLENQHLRWNLKLACLMLLTLLRKIESNQWQVTSTDDLWHMAWHFTGTAGVCQGTRSFWLCWARVGQSKANQDKGGRISQ